MPAGAPSVRDSRSVLVQVVTIVVLIVAICVAILVLLAINQSALLQAERVAGEYHLASSLHAAELNNELGAVERRTYLQLQGESGASGIRGYHRDLLQSLHLVQRKMDHLQQTQALFGQPLFDPPLVRVGDQWDRFRTAVANVPRNPAEAPGEVLGRLEHFRFRLDQLRMLHLDSYRASDTTVAQAVGWRRFYVLALSISLVGLVLIVLIGRQMTRSIHGRRRALEDLATSEERFRQLTGHIDEVFWITSADGQEHIYVSEAYEQVWGRLLEDLRANPNEWVEAVHEDDRDRVEKAFFDLAATDGYDEEYRIIRPDGTVRWIRSRGTPVKNEDGKVYRVVKLAEDITERREAELAARENRRSLETLLGNLPGMFYRCRNDRDWTLEYTNERCRELTGHPPEDLIAKKITLAHPEDREPIWEAVQEAVNERRPFELTYRMMSAQGTEKWVWEQGCGVLDRNGDLLALEGFVTDITDRRLAEVKLRRSERELRLITDNVPARIAYVDEERRYRFVNAGFEQRFGMRREQIIGKSVSDVLGPENYETIAPYIDQVLSGTQASHETLLTSATGDPFWVHLTYVPDIEADGRTVGFYALVTDITERKRAEGALRESEDKYRSIVETTADWIWEMEVPDGRHVFSNRRIAEILGYEHETIDQLDVFGLFHPDDLAEVQQRLPELIRSGEGWNNWTVRFRHKDGTYRFLESSAVPIKNEEGTVTGYRGVDRDITGRLWAEEHATQMGRILEDSLNEIYIFDADTLSFTQVNRGARENLGYSMEELTRLTPLDLKPEFTLESFEKMIAPLKSGEIEVVRFETIHRRKDGSFYDVQVNLQYSGMGDRTVFVAVILDVTERKQSEQRQKLMMMELDHRVKNNLASVLSLANQTCNRCSTLDEFAESFLGRLLAMSKTHEALAKARWSAIDIGEVASITLASYLHEDVERINIEGDPVRIPPDAAMPLCLTLHELSTNAAKYGALSCPDGRVDLTWRRKGESVDLRWEESGGPVVVEPKSTGLGTGLIEGFIRFELQGDVTMDYRPKGLSCCIFVPLVESAGMTP